MSRRLSPEEQLMYSKTLKLLGSLSSNVSYLLAEKTHRFKDLCELLDSVLPEKPKKVIVTVDGKKVTRTLQRGTILNSPFLDDNLIRLFWRETNKAIPNPDSLIPALTADAISESLRSRQKGINLMNKERIEKFVEEKFNMSLEDIEEKLEEATEDDE